MNVYQCLFSLVKLSACTHTFSHLRCKGTEKNVSLVTNV